MSTNRTLAAKATTLTDDSANCPCPTHLNDLQKVQTANPKATDYTFLGQMVI